MGFVFKSIIVDDIPEFGGLDEFNKKWDDVNKCLGPNTIGAASNVLLNGLEYNDILDTCAKEGK